MLKHGVCDSDKQKNIFGPLPEFLNNISYHFVI